MPVSNTCSCVQTFQVAVLPRGLFVSEERNFSWRLYSLASWRATWRSCGPSRSSSMRQLTSAHAPCCMCSACAQEPCCMYSCVQMTATPRSRKRSPSRQTFTRVIRSSYSIMLVSATLWSQCSTSNCTRRQPGTTHSFCGTTALRTCHDSHLPHIVSVAHVCEHCSHKWSSHWHVYSLILDFSMWSTLAACVNLHLFN